LFVCLFVWLEVNMKIENEKLIKKQV